MDKQLTPHFKLSEFTHSYMAEKLRLNNTPSDSVVKNLTRLCQVLLEPIRETYGRPIRVSSGYRCSALNKAVDGVRNSFHLSGRAADIYSVDLDSLKDTIESCYRCGLIRPTEYIVYPRFVHLAL